MLQNAYFLAKIGADTAENEHHFAEILPTGAQEGLGRPAVSATQPRPPQPHGNPYGGQEGFGRPLSWI